MLNAGVLTFKEFAMREPLPLAAVHEAVLEFLRGREANAGLRVKHLIKIERAAWCDLVAVELWNGVRPGDETKALLELENVVVVPHIGSATNHTRGLMGRLVVDNLRSWFAGRGPLTPVPETPWRHGDR